MQCTAERDFPAKPIRKKPFDHLPHTLSNPFGVPYEAKSIDAMVAPSCLQCRSSLLAGKGGAPPFAHVPQKRGDSGVGGVGAGGGTVHQVELEPVIAVGAEKRGLALPARRGHVAARRGVEARAVKVVVVGAVLQ